MKIRSQLLEEDGKRTKQLFRKHQPAEAIEKLIFAKKGLAENESTAYLTER